MTELCCYTGTCVENSFVLVRKRNSLESDCACSLSASKPNEQVRDESNGNNLVGSLEITSCKPFCSGIGYRYTALTQTLPIMYSL